METGLRDKRVLVTGASGGIGSACAREFAAEGARVFVHYHRGKERAEAVAAELGGAPMFGADLTDEAQVDALFDQVRKELGGVDVCAAVAGAWPREDAPVWELPLERWEQTLRENLTASFLTARGFLERGCQVRARQPRLRQLDGRDLRRGRPRRLRRGQVGDHLRATPQPEERGRPRSASRPRERSRARLDVFADDSGELDQKRVDYVTSTMALRKVASPEDVARQVVVLASDEPRQAHVTGQVVTVAGGMEGRLIHP